MMRPMLNDPALDKILAFCAEDPIERVFLEDAARRGFGRFGAVDRMTRVALATVTSDAH